MSAQKIRGMASQIGIHNVKVVGNKIAAPEEKTFIQELLPDFAFAGWIPYSRGLLKADRSGGSVLEGAETDVTEALQQILEEIQTKQ